jgi:hypothetical protein
MADGNDRKLRDELKQYAGWTDADIAALPKWAQDSLMADDPPAKDE